MFGSADESTTPNRAASEKLPEVDELVSHELLKFEKELLGFYITSHPLTPHQTMMERYSTATTREALTMSADAEVMIGGMLSEVKPKVAKSGPSMGQRWAIIGLEDLEGKIEGMVFAEAFANISKRQPDLIKPERIVFVKARVDRKRETP